MPARERAHRDERRRSLGQNFLRPELAARIVAECGFRPGEQVVEIGPGAGALTFALARLSLEVTAVELDREWAARLRERARRERANNVRVLNADFATMRLPVTPFRAIGSLPFARTTDFLRKLFDDPGSALARADLIVQWEVARKRAAAPPATLLSTQWAPWWDFRLGRRIAASEFHPVPRVDAALLVAKRREPALLPREMTQAYAEFVRKRWPFKR